MHKEIFRSREVPRYERTRHRTGRMVVLVVLIALLTALIVVGAWIGYRLLNPTAIRTTTETHAFTLSAGTQPALIVSDDNGFVHVQPGAGNTVTVRTTKVGDSFGASPDDFKVSYSQSGNTINIQVSNDSIHPFDFSTTSQADIEVSVPTSSDLRITTNSGDITTTGIHGKITLISNSGSVEAENVALEDTSNMSSDSGSITMHGSIDTSGRYMFQSNSGNVNVTLPRSMSFHVNLTSNSGTITNNFPLVSTRQSDPSNKTVSGDVGSSPQATVTMQSDSGSLRLGQI